MRWIPAASLGTSPAVPGGLDATGVMRRADKDYIKTGTRAHKWDETPKGRGRRESNHISRS